MNHVSAMLCHSEYFENLKIFENYFSENFIWHLLFNTSYFNLSISDFDDLRGSKPILFF